jgi:N12 class adenine-specific DNA methylase
LASAAAPAPKPAGLKGLTEAENAELATLEAEFLDLIKTQTSSGLDPKLISMAVKIGSFYIKSGSRRFMAVLDAMMQRLGLTLEQAQPYARVAYNQLRDDMDLAGEDVADMDSAEEVIKEVRKMRAAEAKKAKGAPQETGKLPVSQDGAQSGMVQEQEASDEPRDGARPVGLGEDGKQEAGRGGNVEAGQPDGNASDRPVGEAEAGPDSGPDAVRGDKAPRARSGRKVRGSENGPDPGGLLAGGGTPDRSDGLVDAGPGRDEPVQPGRSNYRITNPEALFAGGPKARFAKNKAAIEAYQRVSDEGREPTPEEMDAMASYIGWGSFGQELFQGTFAWRQNVKPEWKDEDTWLRDFLGREAWESAQNSIINAHYTDPPTVKAMWAAIEAMGFKGGRVLEPSMGVGNFFGLMPPHLEQASHLTGIELDKTTGGIAKMLYPKANVRIMGYEKSTTPDSFYDLVIGNWPFANFSPADRRYADLNASLHDYFFVKAVDQVRPGGLVVGITSAFSMDGQKNRNVRLHLARRAEIVASFRLPSGAFERYAGTKVVTDLIILRKRETPIMDTTQETWVQSKPFKTPSGEEINVNQYYIDNPGQVLGTLDFGSGTTYFKAGMIVRRPDNIEELLEGIAKRVPADGYTPKDRRGKEVRFIANNTTDRRFAVTEGADGALYHVQGDQMAALEDVLSYKTSNKEETAKREAQFRALVDIRRKAGAVIDADRDGAEDADTKRAALKKAYQAFRKEHGLIADSYAVGAMRKKLRDPFSGLLLSLENRDGTPAAIMERPTVRAARKLENPSIRDAFVLARNESVMLDLDRVAEIAGKSLAQVTSDLLEAKAIYRTPGAAYQPADVYLAGNVRQKLREAREALAMGEDMAASVEALESVQPEDIPYFQIEARFGADWLAADVNRQFIIETMGIEHQGADDVKLIRGVTGWRVELSDRVARMRGASDITGAPLPGKGGTGLSLRRFIEATLNTQTLSVTESDGDGGTVKDTTSTEKANEKAAELREKFGEWVWKDPERRVEVEASYNEIMNAIATPQVDGSFMEFPGMALQRGDQPFNLRQHQSDAIWRGVLNQRGIYGHEVGTGKTITMTGIAVESRRYGLAKKPLLIAHNANSSAVATEAQETYPGAKIMYVDNLAPDQIEAQLSRMATEDWDLIVIPHSLIDRMALSEATLMQMAAADIAAYEAEAIAAAEDEGIKLTTQDMDGDAKDLTKKLFNSPTAKEMVKARNRLIEQIRKQAMRASKEGAVNFENLGIDMILVDESHEFKKPPIPTRMQVKGLNTATSNRALALRFLTSYIKEQRGGTGVHVFTGTPITNTLAEIYHQMYYVMDDVMRLNKVDTWDGFFKAFANTIADVEVTATNEYENVERLAAFINVSELRRMAGQYMDIVFADDMPEFKPRTTDSGKDMRAPDLTDAERKELLDGRRDPTPDKPLQGRPYKQVIHDIAPMGADQKRILGDVVSYARIFKNAGGKARREIMLRGGPDAPIVYNNVPNRASMDARLQEIDAEDHPQSKANRAVARIAQIYLEEPMATQVLFMDEGYSDETVSVKTAADGSKTKTKKQKFNLSADIVAKLVKAGVKESEIAIVAGGVTADQKRIISDKMNRREIRVVIGQTKTLGVGVNMQKYLRAMHHLDAPWMPGDLEQRNGRGQRQGNTWNTVLEFRYLTEGLDGRRWQVLAIKDRFIKAFLKAKQGVRTIEGDAADDAESMDGSSLADTLSEASGDPRLMQSNKLDKRITKLKSRERIHTQGIAEAIAKAKRLRAQAERESEALPPRREDSAHVLALREAGAFSATVNGKTYTERPEAAAAIDEYLEKAALAIPKGGDMPLAVEVNGFKVNGEVPRWATTGQVNLSLTRKGAYTFMKPSLASIESTIRRIPERLAETEETLADIEKQAARLDAMAKQPFAQAADLAQKQADLAALKADMEANPVPPPNWLRQGAPIDTLIYVNGKERVVTGHRWTSEGWFVATAEGDVDYGEAKDASGIPLYEPRMFEAPVVSEGSKMKNGDDADGDVMESRIPGRGDPVASLTGQELGAAADILALGKAAAKWYRDNLVGQQVTNAETGWSIRFSRRGANKIGGRKGQDLYRMVPALREIIGAGTLMSSEPALGPNSDIKMFYKFRATVSLNGVSKDVVATVREDATGKYHYDLSRNMEDGARWMLSPRIPVMEAGAKETDSAPTELNIDFAQPARKQNDSPSGWGEVEADAPITDAAIASITRDLNAELARSGLAGKASVRVVKGLTNAAGVSVGGVAAGSRIGINPDSPYGVMGTMRHEIVHVLRNAALWGKEYGLFTADEWRGLVRAARADKAIEARVDSLYKDRSEAVRTEEKVAELYREWAAKRDQTGPVAATLRKIMGFLEAVANALRGRGFQSAARTMERIARGDVGRRGPEGGALRDSAGRYVGTWAEGMEARDAARDSAFAATIMRELAQVDDLFQNPPAKGKTLEQVFKELDPTVQYIGDVARQGKGSTFGDRARSLGAEKMHLLRTGGEKKADFFVYEANGEVWIDVSQLDQGGAGSRVYASVADYAFNTGQVFIGDPEGLSQIAMRRRTEAMLSSALKHGTTKHLAPHPSQTKGDGGIGVAPLKWTEGDDAGNLASLIEASVANITAIVPEIDRAQYDFATGTFRNSQGEPLSDGTLDKWSASRPRIRAAGAGRNTLKRGILLNTLARTESGAQSALLEYALRQPGKLVAGGLSDTFYSLFPGDAAELRMPDVPYAANEAEFDAKERSIISNILTDLMGGKSPRYNLLGLVPGRALFAELGKNLPGAQRYLRLKEDMDAMRSDWHGRTDEVAQAWRKIMSGNMAANRSLMDLMHEATREGVDPSQPFVAPKRRPGMTPDEHTTQVAGVKTAWNSLKAKFDALPPEFKAMFNTVRDTYDDMATAFEKAVLDNATKAMSIGLERAERRYNDDLAAIRDEGLTGDAKAEAEDAAKKRLATAKKTHGWNKNARISQLRQQFESNRLDGPYFPLQRFGTYFVTIRDVDGKVVSFSRFESEKKQRAFAAEQRRVVGQDVQAGVMEDNTAGLRDQVDPNFVADIEKIIGDTIKDPAVMDMVWQRWLETLPDFSVRKSRIHRKGTQGFDGDAFRAFGRQVFHGSHQLARLTYALDMQKALEDARREAAATSDPNRNGLIVNEMDRRHKFTMNPKGGALAQFATSAAFVYYLGMTPAAAVVNLSQTTVIGIPTLAAGFNKGGITRASAALTGAMRDFVAGRGSTQRSSRLTADESAAMEEGYRRGVIDKSQAHDLAGVSESGVEYSDRRMWVMSWFSLLFHHAERLNREVTFLAAYRMARDNNFGHADAIQKAADLTWKTHFDYQNTSRPRLMQNDTAKVLLVFRNFQINMLWRLFRDSHQAMHGRSEADRREARGQLIGISAMMMFHAGIKGVWGYALLTTILGLLVPGGSDEIEEEIKAGIVNTFGPGAGGLLLNGVPGHITGIDLTNRLGMPELWFRKSDRQLEGDDEYNYFLQEMVGAAPGIVENVWRGTNLAMDGEIVRGVETAAPKFARDLMKGYRYFDEGVTTIKGDPLLDDLPAGDSFLQALGFTPAQVSERYEINTRLKNAEKRITDERRSILSDATSAIRDGAQIPLKTMDAINAFNAANPDYPITGDTIKRSLRARMRASEDMEGGIRINPRIDQRLRDGAAPAIYQ